MKNAIISITPSCAKKLLALASNNRTKTASSAITDGCLRMKAVAKAKTVSSL